MIVVLALAGAVAAGLVVMFFPLLVLAVWRALGLPKADATLGEDIYRYRGRPKGDL